MPPQDPVRTQTDENLRRLYARPPAGPLLPDLAALLAQLAARNEDDRL